MPAELPACEDVDHVEPHAIHEEEVPTLESLGVYRHFAEASTRAAAREEDGGWRLSLDPNLARHGDTTTKFSSHVPEEPVLRDIESWVLVEGFDEQLPVPEGDGTVGEGR